MSTKIDRENRKKLEEQLNHDPETDLKMTLEEAKQGAEFTSNGVG